MEKRSIAIVGVGAIGGAIAADLADAGHRVVLCSRSPFACLVVTHPAGLMKTLLADGGLTDILHAFKDVRPARNHSQAQQASPVVEPPHAEEQPRAENGAQESQVAEHLPPNRPPQSPAPQEPRVRESPGGSTGPRRVDIGLSADSLGLLGLRGDTSFVDRPLV